MAEPGVRQSRMKYALRMTEAHHGALRSHLFPGDGKEAVALLLCGRRNGVDRHILTVKKVVTIPHDVCDRRPDRVTWPTEFVDPLLGEAYGRGYAIVKVHCHGIDYRRFSPTDDESDSSLFSAVTSLLNDGPPVIAVELRCSPRSGLWNRNNRDPAYSVRCRGGMFGHGQRGGGAARAA